MQLVLQLTADVYFSTVSASHQIHNSQRLFGLNFGRALESKKECFSKSILKAILKQIGEEE
jgi:hypothetical protein